MKQAVCQYDELKPKEMKAIMIERKPIVVIRSKEGDVYALRNVCPHKGPNLSDGAVDSNTSGTEVGDYVFDNDTEVIRCPWHSWEFDIKTGCSMFDPDNIKVRKYEVTIEEGTVFVHV